MNKETEWLLREKYSGVESDEFRSDVLRLEKGEPIDYVIGFSKFLGSHIDLSFRTLIPRTETEYWTEIAIKEIKETFREKEIKILDIFSGSGCIGISILKHLPQAHTDFSDIESKAISQIKKNLELNEIDENRYIIYSSDLFMDIPEANRYDVTFANPPYISYADKPNLDDSVINYEPHEALFADDDGLDLVKKTIDQGFARLNEGGLLYIEFNEDQKEAIEVYLKDHNISNYSFHKDQFEMWRWVRIGNPQL